jgi:hypothetical protein
MVATKKPQVPIFLKKFGKITKPPIQVFWMFAKSKEPSHSGFLNVLQNQENPPIPSFWNFSKELGIPMEEKMENPPIRVRFFAQFLMFLEPQSMFKIKRHMCTLD